MGRYCLILGLMTGLFSANVAAEQITLVKDGASEYVIATVPDPTPQELLAAQELAKYIGQMSGAQLSVQQGRGDAAKSIIICEQSNLHRSGVRVAFQQMIDQEECSISGVGSNDVLLVGARGRSVLYAVYQFLDQLGCRFLAPQFHHYNGAAEVVPEKKTLVLTDEMRRRSHPKLAFRKLYVEEGHSHTTDNLVQMVEWMPKVGYNTLVVPLDYQGTGRVKWDNFRAKVAPECQKRGIIIEVGGHGYQNFLNASMEDGKFFTDHPEWFGMDEKGKRSKAKNRVFCTSNPNAVAYLTKNFLSYIKDRPEIQIFDFWPPDGAKWCECDDCRKLGTPPDRQAILLDQVKKAVAPVRPDLRLEIIAYSSYLDPPPTAKVDKSVLVDFCPINQQFDHQINDPAAERNKNYADALQAWRKTFDGDISIYSYYRKYAWDSLPVIIPHYMQKDLQWYAKVPVQGVSTYAEPGDWFTYELNHYVLAQLAWDPDAPVDPIIEKFCQARYGDHAQSARNALLALQDTVRNYGSIPFTKLKQADEIAKARTRLEQQQQKIASLASSASDPSHKLNLTRLTRMLRYAADDIAVQEMRASKADTTAIKKKAEEIHSFVTQHKDDGIFLVHNQRLSLSRKLRRYGIQAAE